ncbi:MAG: hypothetical protein H7Y13_16665 [Sphingobacteriaceae bacterium]|nr:hypothetical protein [Sphingobacteriaceae bacterium]
MRLSITCIILLKLCLFQVVAQERISNSCVAKVNETFTLADEKFTGPLWSSMDWQSFRIYNSFTLQLQDNSQIPAGFAAIATIEVKYWKHPSSVNPVPSDPETGTKTFQLRVDKPAASGTGKFSQTYEMPTDERGGYVVAKVLNVSYINGNAQAENFVKLSGTLLIDRVFNMSGAAVMFEASLIDNNKVLSVDVDSYAGAEEFDIEWTLIDQGTGSRWNTADAMNSSNLSQNTAPLGEALDDLFRNNATRVSTQEDYKIPLVYNTKYIAVRVRPVQYRDGFRVEGTWQYSLKPNNGFGAYAIWTVTPHQTNLNWLMSATYAEEGKKKNVLTYFDGALRQRQAITINNSDHVTTAQENIYDPFGRQVVSILPAPVSTAGLNYIPKLNLSDTRVDANNVKLAYSYLDVNNAGCEAVPAKLSNTSGTGLYYSSSAANTFKSQLNGVYIPEANGYPFSVTQFMPDNTGRVKVQGGVGEKFQPGDMNNHVTKYYYAKPQQWELDRMFGSDAGRADHYSKNIVLDPNGQLSINYLNAAGKTVATALTSHAPANLESLATATIPADNSPEVKFETLFRPEEFVFNNTNLTLSGKGTYVTTIDNQLLKVQFTMDQLVSNYLKSGQSFCKSCEYAVKIKVTDACGLNVSYSPAAPIIIGGAAALDCINKDPQRIDLDVQTTTVGEYYFSFEFALNRENIDAATKDFVTNALAGKQLTNRIEYILQEIQKINFSTDFNDCKTCTEKLLTDEGLKAAFAAKFLELQLTAAEKSDSRLNAFIQTQYNQLKQSCTNLQTNCVSDICSRAEQSMLADLSPGGQFASFIYDGSTNSPLDPLTNILFRHFKTAVGSDPGVFSSHADVDETADKVILEDGSVIYPDDAAFGIDHLIKYWKPRWGQKFLQFHPEICKLDFCKANAGSNNWDYQVTELVNSLSEAEARFGAFASTDTEYLLRHDPFFTGRTSLYQEFLTKLNNYSLEVNPAAPVKSLSAYIDFSLYCGYTPGSGANLNGSAVESGDLWMYQCSPLQSCRVKQREWDLFKRYYSELKQKVVYKYRDEVDCAGSNPCKIGPDFTINGSSACVEAKDFVLEYNSARTGCGPNQSVVRLKYTKGSIPQNITVNLVYPPAFYRLNYNNTLTYHNLPTKVSFVKGESQREFCVYHSVSRLMDIRISHIECGSNYSGKAMVGKWKKTGKREVTYNSQMEVITDVPISELNTVAYDYHFLVDAAFRQPAFVYFEDQPKKDWDIDQTTNELVIGAAGSQERFFIISLNEKELVLLKKTGTYSDLIITYKLLPYDDIGAYPEGPELEITNNTSGWGTVIYTPKPVTTGPAQADICNAYKNKISRFPELIASLPAGFNPQVYKYEHEVLLKEQIATSCEASSILWMKRLDAGIEEKYASSTLSERHAIKTNIRQALINLCANAGDVDHLYGASTLPSAKQTTGGLNSFEDILNSFDNGGGLTSKFNPWLIEYPLPYETISVNNNRVISNTGTAICDALTALIAQKPSAQNENSFLEEKLTLANAEVLDLKKSCSNCRYLLEQDQLLSPLLQGANSSCITSATVSSAVSVLNGKLSGGFSASSPNYLQILTTYLNQTYGRSLSASSIARLNSGKITELCPDITFSNIKADAFASTKAGINTALYNAITAYDTYITEESKAFRQAYIQTCGSVKASASLKVAQGIYHYTLYYYDDGGNLVRTVPPAGVNLLNAEQTKAVEAARKAGATNDCVEFANYSVTTDEATAFNGLSTTLENPAAAAAEFWLYNGSNQNSQTLITTSDKQYMLDVCINNDHLNVVVYTLKDASGSMITISRSNHITFNIASRKPLSDWTHLVIQAADGMSSGQLKVYLNGLQLSGALGGSPSGGCGWEISTSGGVLSVPKNISALKHLRTYQREMSNAEIAQNAASACFIPLNMPVLWARFNVPAPGSSTTVGAGSTVERSMGPNYPAHTMITYYAYNSLNQVDWQKTPDGGESRFWYDEKGRLIASQNARQYAGAAKKYSYTRYDDLGRIIEVGEKTPATQLDPEISFLTEGQVQSLLADNYTGDSQITKTYYDEPASPQEAGIEISIPSQQQNLEKRVAATTYRATRNAPTVSGTYYSYDIAGNVDKLWQSVPGLGLKKIQYQYDLVSGKVNFVAYQHETGGSDGFYYRYKYDAENRLTEAYGGTEGELKPEGGSYIVNERQLARYYYYKHGPLARVELGDEVQKIQGVDYAYTLQGWLKGVNGAKISAAMADVQGSSIPKDVMGYSLGYYEGDYTAIGAGATAFDSRIATTENLGKNLYNGNISQIAVSLSKFNDISYAYRYDQLNRLVAMNPFNGNTKQNAYAEKISYDGNGNIKTYERNDKDGNVMDNLSYSYKTGNNQLRQVSDAVTTANIPEDLESGQGADNYRYDEIGNLVADDQSNPGEKLTDIKWTVYGKIESVTKEVNGQVSVVNYKYDPSGNRISKEVNGKTTYYIRDAQGNTLSLYSQENGTTKWDEQYLYGSSRLGLWKPSEVAGVASNVLWNDYRGAVNYQMSNHLGNVLAVVSDRTVDGNNGKEAEVLSATDYAPFGMELVGRTFNNGNYRYGFNGQEKDDEVAKGLYTAEYWEYDSRIGRRWNVDPIVKPWESPYLAFSGNPIYFADPHGDNSIVTVKKDKEGKITGINVSAKVFIKGSGASKERATALTKSAKETYKTKTVDGVVVSFDIEFIYDPKKKEENTSTFNGENLLTFSKKPENNNVTPRDVSHVNAFTYAGSPTRYAGETGTIHNSGKSTNTVMHETLHLLGLSDRYDEQTGKPHKGYGNDIMGAAGKTAMSVSHYRNLIEHVKSNQTRISKQGVLISTETVDLKYDKKGKPTLKH